MAEKKRQCGTCRFFIKNEDTGYGTCGNPLRKKEDTQLLLIRPSELACRTQWGTSLWQHPDDLSDPVEQPSPQQPTLPEPIAAQLSFDDEVTSVSIAGSKPTLSSFEDDVIDTRVASTGMASWNDPVQQERMDLLNRSNHDALAGAQKRFREKQSRQRDLVPFADDPQDESNGPTTPTNQAPASAPASPVAASSFPPDDFVENEGTSASDDSSFEDEMVDEGIARGVQRTPRMRKLLRGPDNPKPEKAMKFSMPSEMQVTSHNPEQREQWNSVPTLTPGFDLPLSHPEKATPPASTKMVASAAVVPTHNQQVRTVSQARERVTEDRLRQERAQRQLVAPLAEEPRLSSAPTMQRPVTRRPEPTQHTTGRTTPVEQLKSSPLRGHHPATRKLLQQNQDERENQTPVMRPTQQVTTRAQAPRPQFDAAPERTSPVRQSQQQAPPRQARPDMQAQSPRQSQSNYRMQEMVSNTPFVQEEITISPDVPRCCGTCASFRPGGADGRGSCTNAYAGPIERTVFEQDEACRRSFGSFWLPANEEVWLGEVPRFTAPTPRVDAMLERKRRKQIKEVPLLPDLEELTS